METTNEKEKSEGIISTLMNKFSSIKSTVFTDSGREVAVIEGNSLVINGKKSSVNVIHSD